MSTIQVDEVHVHGAASQSISRTGAVRALQVSRSGFYRWKSVKHEVCAVDQAVSTAFAHHKARAGAPCLTADVRATGVLVSERTVGRSLRKQGLRCRHKRKFRHATDSKHNLPIAPNLLNRQFTVRKPNVAWVGDITYLQTQEGWLYLATMIDLFNRQVIGWQISTKIDQALVNDALTAALTTRGKPSDVIVHTDRGSQYCAKSFKDILKEHGCQRKLTGSNYLVSQKMPLLFSFLGKSMGNILGKIK